MSDRSPEEFARSAKPAPQSEKVERRKRLEAAADEAREKRKDALGAAAATEKMLIKDLMRVADDLDNPYPGTCSRARYRKFGWFREATVFDIFGNHEQFQRAAGLRDSRTTTAYRNRRAALKAEEGVLEYAEKHVLPWVGRHDREPRGDRIARSLIVGSDFHGKHVDPFALDVFIDVIRRAQPDYVVLNGDVLDFVEVGRWAKNPRKLLDLQGEIDWTVANILRPVRAAAPKAQIDLVIGNHEYRLVRYLADTAPGLASLRCLAFEELLALDELQISLVHNQALLAPTERTRKEQSRKTWKVYHDCYVVTHGTATGKFPSSKELNKYGMSGTSGHVHRPQMHSMPTLQNQHADWMTTGMMCGHSSGDEYLTGPSTWTIGFGFVTLFPKERVAIQRPVIVKRGVTEFEGVVYRRTPKRKK